MAHIKHQIICFRNALCFSYAWLALCSAIASIVTGNNAIAPTFLLELLFFCGWGSLCFTLCFANPAIRKRGFLFSLTLFFLAFAPVEALSLHHLGAFEDGNSASWIVFGAVLTACYLSCLFLDARIFKKASDLYTERLNEHLAQQRPQAPRPKQP